MEGPSMFNTAIPLIIAAFIAFHVPHIDALTVDETCAVVKNATFIANPENCQKWAYCLNGSPLYGECKSGLLYDAPSGTCDYPDRVSCSSNITTMCAGTTGVYKADPYNCQNYCYCYEGVTYTASCPAGQYYEHSTNECIWSQYSKCTASSPCLLAQNGFIKDTTSCDGWLRCAGGQVVDSGNCPSGYYYNAYTALCDFPQNVPCSSAGTTVAPNAPTPKPGLCSAVTKATFFPDGKTCRGYFVCKDSTVTNPPWGKCPTNSVFNDATQQCNDPYQVPCPYDRCEGMTTKKFMAVAGTSCNEYYICSGGGANVGTGKCPTGYLVFNELAGVCQTDEFNYPICTEAANTD